MSESIIIEGVDYLIGLDWVVWQTKAATPNAAKARFIKDGYKSYTVLTSRVTTGIGATKDTFIKKSASLAGTLAKELKPNISYQSVVDMGDGRSWYVAINNGMVIADSDVILPSKEALTHWSENSSIGQWEGGIYNSIDEAVAAFSEIIKGRKKVLWMRPSPSNKGKIALAAAGVLVVGVLAVSAWVHHRHVVEEERLRQLAMERARLALLNKQPITALAPQYAPDTTTPPWRSMVKAGVFLRDCHALFLQAPLYVMGYAQTDFHCNKSGRALVGVASFSVPTVNLGLKAVAGMSDQSKSGFTLSGDGQHLEWRREAALKPDDYLSDSDIPSVFVNGRPTIYWQSMTDFQGLGSPFALNYMPLKKGVITYHLTNAESFRSRKMAVPPLSKSAPAPWAETPFSISSPIDGVGLLSIIPDGLGMTEAQTSSGGSWAYQGVLFDKGGSEK